MGVKHENENLLIDMACKIKQIVGIALWLRRAFLLTKLRWLSDWMSL